MIISHLIIKVIFFSHQARPVVVLVWLQFLQDLKLTFWSPLTGSKKNSTLCNPSITSKTRFSFHLKTFCSYVSLNEVLSRTFEEPVAIDAICKIESFILSKSFLEYTYNFSKTLKIGKFQSNSGTRLSETSFL